MIDRDRWQKIEEIFNQALDLPETERDGWLRFACGDDADLRFQVQSLLESDRAAAGAFVGSKVERAVTQLGTEISDAVGRRFGPYRLMPELGRGGMGAVYLAVRDDEQYESEVAIKLVRPGLPHRLHFMPLPPGTADSCPAVVRRRHCRRRHTVLRDGVYPGLLDYKLRR